MSTDNQVVFAGGLGINKQNKQNQAVLTAVRFDKTLRIIDELIISDNNATVVSCVKRGNSDNILFAGCLRCVYVIEWSGGKLTPLMVALDVHTSNLR